MGDFTINDELLEAFHRKSIIPYRIRIATPEEFYGAIGKAKIVNAHGAFVTQHTIEEYKQMKYLFLTSDGTAGIAVTQDNNIVSVFNGGGKERRLKNAFARCNKNGWSEIR